MFSFKQAADRGQEAPAGALRSVEAHTEVFRLSERETFVLRGDARGSVIFCRAGSAWITQENDAQDHLLQGEERFVVTHKGRVVVQGFPAACLAVQRSGRRRG